MSENKRYIVAVLCTESLEAARELAKRKSKEEDAVALIGEVIEEVRFEKKKKETS